MHWLFFVTRIVYHVQTLADVLQGGNAFTCLFTYFFLQNEQKESWNEKEEIENQIYSVGIKKKKNPSILRKHD